MSIDLIIDVIFVAGMLGAYWGIGTVIGRIIYPPEPAWKGVIPEAPPPPPVKLPEREFMDPESPEAEELVLNFLRDHKRNRNL